MCVSIVCHVASTGGALIPYHLNESKGWAMDIQDLKKSVRQARAEGKHVRGLVFINPGNPTGTHIVGNHRSLHPVYGCVIHRGLYSTNVPERMRRQRRPALRSV